MSDLLQRLKNAQAQVDAPLPSLSHLSLAQLDEYEINFGKTHVGKTYKTMWETEQSWIHWFLSHYRNSQKGDHRTFLRYVELMIERAELTGQPVLVTPSPQVTKPKNVPTGKGSGKAYPKSKAKAQPVELPSVEELLDPSELLEDMESIEIIPAQSPDVSHLEQRMLHLENALSRVIHHLEEMSVNQQASPTES